MIVERHDISWDGRKDVYRSYSADFDDFVKWARKASSSLTGAIGAARGCYQFGSLFEPDSHTVVKAIRVGAEANAALVAAAWLEGPPSLYRLGDGPPVSYSGDRPIDSAHVGHWLAGFDLAMISRQHDLLDLLASISTDALRKSPTTSSPEVTFRAVDLRRALWIAPRVTADPAYLWQCQFVAGCTSRSLLHRANRTLGRSYLALFPPLERGDEAAFSEALTEALLQHKQFYSSTDKLRKEPEGFVSLSLTAVAALAWDRGLRFDVESDYAPRSWVTGELFR